MATKRCPEELKFWDFVRDRLPPEEKADFRRHILRCPICSEICKQIKKRDPVTNPVGARKEFERFMKIVRKQGL